MSSKNYSQLIKAADSLEDEYIAVHTNRNRHVWSLKTPDSKAKLLAYAQDTVVLYDVLWTQPTLSSARKTFHTKPGDRNAGQRSVQAFAKGIFLGQEVPSFKDEGFPSYSVRYRPTQKHPSWVGAFRIYAQGQPLHRKGIRWSEYAVLHYTQPIEEFSKAAPGSRPYTATAYGEIELLDAAELKAFNKKIQQKE